MSTSPNEMGGGGGGEAGEVRIEGDDHGMDKPVHSSGAHRRHTHQGVSVRDMVGRGRRFIEDSHSMAGGSGHGMKKLQLAGTSRRKTVAMMGSAVAGTKPGGRLSPEEYKQVSRPSC